MLTFVFLLLLADSKTASAQMVAKHRYMLKMLCILDGEIIFDPDTSRTLEALEEISIQNIGFTHQIKPEKALKIYGNRGRNGVFLMYSGKDPKAVVRNHELILRHTTTHKDDPYQDFKELHPTDTIMDGTNLKRGQVLPEFPGGNQELAKFISERLKYPDLAKDNYIMGRVQIGFIIDEKGSISDMRVVYGKDLACDLSGEALRLCRSLPRFYPGTNDGKPAKTYYFIPILFKLNTGDDSL